MVQKMSDMIAEKMQSRDFNSLIVMDNGSSEKRISEAKTTLDIHDTNSITTFGVKAQRAVNTAADNILKTVKTKDVGPVADSLNKIVTTIRGLDTSSLSKKPGFIAKLFKVTAPVVAFMASLETTEAQVDNIVEYLDRSRSQLARSVAQLDQLYRETENSAKDLEIYIAALKEKMDEFENEALPVMKKRAEDNVSPMAGQEYSDAKAIYDRLDRKYINLKLTRQVTLQNLPSIRLTQDHDVSLLEKINDVSVHVVPLWKRQLAIALEVQKTDGACKAINATTDLTNEMLVSGAKQMKIALIDAQKTIERSVIDVAAVEEANSVLIETISTTQVMIAEGREARRLAEQSLQKAETNLRQAITAQ